MSDESKVYWASPIEVASLRNTSKNMVTNNLVKTRLILDKILDNISPYLNAGVQGEKSFWRAAVDNPIRFGSIMAQYATAATISSLAIYMMEPETYENLVGSKDMENNIIIILH